MYLGSVWCNVMCIVKCNVFMQCTCVVYGVMQCVHVNVLVHCNWGKPKGVLHWLVVNL